jgi:protein SCO1
VVNPRIAIALVLVGALALGGVVLAAKSGGDEEPVAAPNQFAGATMPADARAPGFQLRDEQGEQVSMRGLRGQPVVVTFLYSHCQDTCPITAQTIRGALDDLGHDVPALAISVAPSNDTPASARKFLAEQRTGGRIRFVLGSRAQLRPIWTGYGITPQRVTEEHLAHITLVDARGFQRVGYPIAQATPERLAHDLRLLERESG